VRAESADAADLDQRYARAAAFFQHRTYRSYWLAFAGWCAARALVGMPASASVVRLYLVYLAAAGKAVSTIRLARATIIKAHLASGYPSPALEPLRATMYGIARKLGVTAQRSVALRPEDLRALVLTCADDPTGVRDRAILLVGHYAQLCHTELAALDVDDVSRDREGLILRIGGDDNGRSIIMGAAAQRDALLCPMRALDEWLPVRARWASRPGITPLTGALFLVVPGHSRHARVGARMSARDAYRVLLRRGELADLDPHVLRRGASR
jgi:integrase